MTAASAIQRKGLQREEEIEVEKEVRSPEGKRMFSNEE
jgi:hypothetical protein